MKYAEDRLQAACVTWFDMQHPKKKALLFHPANGGSRNALEAMKLKKMGVRAGVADLVFLCNGRAYFIELKTPVGKQSEYQREFEKLVESQGFEYILVRSLDQFILAIREIENAKGRAVA